MVTSSTASIREALSSIKHLSEEDLQIVEFPVSLKSHETGTAPADQRSRQPTKSEAAIVESGPAPPGGKEWVEPAQSMEPVTKHKYSQKRFDTLFTARDRQILRQRVKVLNGEDGKQPDATYPMADYAITESNRGYATRVGRRPLYTESRMVDYGRLASQHAEQNPLPPSDMARMGYEIVDYLREQLRGGDEDKITTVEDIYPRLAIEENPKDITTLVDDLEVFRYTIDNMKQRTIRDQQPQEPEFLLPQTVATWQMKRAGAQHSLEKMGASPKKTPTNGKKRGRKEGKDEPSTQPPKRQRRAAGTAIHPTESELATRAQSSTAGSGTSSVSPSGEPESPPQTSAPTQRNGSTTNNQRRPRNPAAARNRPVAPSSPDTQIVATSSGAAVQSQVAVQLQTTQMATTPAQASSPSQDTLPTPPNSQNRGLPGSSAPPVQRYTPTQTRTELLAWLDSKIAHREQKRSDIENDPALDAQTRKTKLRANKTGSREYICGRDICVNGREALEACGACQSQGSPCMVWPENPNAKQQRCARCAATKVSSSKCTASRGSLHDPQQAGAHSEQNTDEEAEQPETPEEAE